MRKVEMTHWLKDVFKVFTAKSMGNPGGRAIKGGFSKMPSQLEKCSIFKLAVFPQKSGAPNMCDRDVDK